jgi:hypothetical protein
MSVSGFRPWSRRWPGSGAKSPYEEGAALEAPRGAPSRHDSPCFERSPPTDVATVVVDEVFGRRCARVALVAVPRRAGNGDLACTGTATTLIAAVF